MELERQKRFLEPRLADLSVPVEMAGFEAARDLLLSAWRGGWRVGVFGDYDVDGVTTATILTTFLEALGIEVVARVASRDSGYGFTREAATAFHESGVQLVLLGDCGTSDHEALSWLRAKGMLSAVIDHHQVPSEMPPTDALLNPHQRGCGFPFKGLCSAGVAFYLCAALRTAIARECANAKLPDPRGWLDLVALGTVCDMVPLVDENRILVRHGLRMLEHRLRPGVRALLDAAGIGRDEPLDEGHLGFKLGPRINAPGRLGPAEPSLQLLRARTNAEARAMATRVEACNSRRRSLQEATVAEAMALLQADPRTEGRSGIVVGHDGWLHGIVGIAANGIVERYRRPALVLALDRERGEARGSARSYGSIDVRAALEACAGMVGRYGGHRAAAGVTLELERVPELVEAFDQAVAAQLTAAGGAAGASGEVHDGVLELRDIHPDFMDAIERLAPFGIEFPAPRFVCEEAEVMRERMLRGRHLSVLLRQGGDVHHEAIAFDYTGPQLRIGDRVGCVFTPARNHFRGRVRIQLHLERVWRTGRR
ncbi:MAG: single-stranded-DNA-specific exonuclease RecJ [Myxococcales bacterium]|nr:single-stranded-DNA-specific exonuclease RecJ [Myxococcales bacterium]MCB9752760.1 single-stranded-DNA-specific exonuclease RecJ [Myxococcales bacterium]